uniref:DUF3444 domain-containing protein n=1 Tax=Heterorhabditis bacteriophora TaxID=37862 RepID=A0A1I7WUF7_HETBA
MHNKNLTEARRHDWYNTTPDKKMMHDDAAIFPMASRIVNFTAAFHKEKKNDFQMAGCLDIYYTKTDHLYEMLKDVLVFAGHDGQQLTWSRG